MAVISPGCVQLFDLVEHIVAGSQETLPTRLALNPATSTYMARVSINSLIEEIESGYPNHR